MNFAYDYGDVGTVASQLDSVVVSLGTVDYDELMKSVLSSDEEDEAVWVLLFVVSF